MIGGCSRTYPVVYCIGQIVVVKIVEPKRYPLWPEQVLIAVLLTSRNGGIQACCEIQQIKRGRVTGINVEAERPQVFEIRLPWHLSQTVRAAFTINVDPETAGFDQACQDPLQRKFETRLKTTHPTKLAG